jgi:glycosyltransferase involved in cell wall biosynthesis
MRILYLHGSFVSPSPKLDQDRFALLGRHLRGEVLHPIWFQSKERIEAEYGPDSYPARKVGGFRYHWVIYGTRGNRIERMRQFWFFLRKGLQLHREEPFDCIIAYSYQMLGLAGVILKWLTGAKLIVEIATSPEHVHLVNRPVPTLADRMARLYSDFCLHLTMLACDRAHVLAPNILTAFPRLRGVRQSVFHDFVVVSQVPNSARKPELRVIFVGAPWYLKGVDILIAAFRRLEQDFPDAKLQLLGHFTDRAGLEELIAGSHQIEIVKAKLHPEALEMISAASVLVLPSRCEGMGRVLIEAMSAGIPVIGSDVGGIPHIVRDGVNGFVFPSEDVDALEDRLRRLLSDQELRDTMGKRGRKMAEQEFSESRYVEQFTAMVEATVKALP